MDKKVENSMIEVSVVIPAKNEGETIAKCLAAVMNQEPARAIEIIVIDSGSTDNTVDIVRRTQGVKLVQIKSEDFGHGKTRNLGAQKAAGEFIVFLNADAEPVSVHWLEQLIRPLQTDPHLAGVYSRHLPKPGCYAYMIRDLLTSMPPERKIRIEAGPMDFMLFSTVSAAMRRDIWGRFPFEPGIVIAEDQEWAKRVLAEGFHILYQPTSLVRHSHNYTPEQLRENKRLVGLASGRYHSKFSARTVGFVLMIGGMVLKSAGDLWFILFKYPGQLSFSQKLKEIKIAMAARVSGFRGRYAGWVQGAGKGGAA